MAIISSTITYYRSTSYSFQATVVPPEGLTVETGLFTIKTESFDDDPTDDSAIVKKTVSAVDNVCEFDIAPTDITDATDPANLFYGIHMIMSDGKIYPFAAGKFNLKATPTNREA